MFIENRFDIFLIEIASVQTPVGEDKIPYELNQLLHVPGLVRSAEPLFAVFYDLSGKNSFHAFAQQVFSGKIDICFGGLDPGIVQQIFAGNLCREIHEFVVQERHSRFQRMRHTQLVLNDQNSVQKRFGVKSKRFLDEIVVR